MYFSDVIYLSFLMILLFIIIYKGFKHQAEHHIRNSYISTNTTTNRPRRRIEIADRQGNIFTIANETTNNQLPHRCTDFYYVEQNADDAARIRAQLEKDEKDLPTYEEVMAMSLAEANASTLGPPPAITTSNTSVATTDTVVPVPPYPETDRNVLPAVHQPSNSGTTTCSTQNATGGAGAASTSRAAAVATTNTPATVVTIANSVSNTSV